MTRDTPLSPLQFNMTLEDLASVKFVLSYEILTHRENLRKSGYEPWLLISEFNNLLDRYFMN